MWQPIFAQNAMVKTRHLTTEDGLSHNTVHAFHQDQLGFIWIATAFGMNRWNGHQFQQFTKNENGLSDNTAHQIFEDAQGFIWFFSKQNQSLSFVNIYNFECYSVLERFESNLPFKVQDIAQIFNNKKLEIVIQTMDESIFLLDKTDTWQRINLPNNHPNL